MGLGFDIGNILQQYGGVNPNQPPNDIENHFDQVAQNAPHDDLADGLNEAFRSDQTPPFPNMVGQMFGQADPNQRAGMMNQLLATLGPAVVGAMLNRGMGGGMGGGLGGGLGGSLGGALGGGMGGGIGGGILGSLLNGAMGGGQQQMRVRPEDVERMRPEEFEELARHAERENPGVIDQMSRFYAQNPGLVKALGGAALAIALGKMSQRGR